MNHVMILFIFSTGLIPIMIGKKAVDPLTGELSPISGVRVTPKSSNVIPVTLSSSGHVKRKPPLGATALLEDEIVARTSFWRRQRQREEELTLKEHQLTQSLLFNMDSMNSKKLEKHLTEIDAQAHASNESAKREVQRRAEAEEEYAAVLPPDVIAVLRQGDESERDHEESHVGAHVRFADTIRKLSSKLQAEEKKFKDRISDLEGALNPEAENVALQRYKQAKTRLQSELREQIRTRMEVLDAEHSALEYARQRSELLTKEAKAVLTRSVLLAGDYDAQLSGVYGNTDGSSESTDSELIPLLKQLIALLEAGGPFYLSADLLNLIQGGGQTTNVKVTDTSHKVNLAKTATQSNDQDSNITTVKPLQKSPDSRKTKTDDETVYVVGDPSKLDPNVPKSEDDMANKGRYLFEKQSYETTKLESGLLKNEIDSINDTIKNYAKGKREATEKAQDVLEKKLQSASTEQEKEKIMMEYAKNLQHTNEALEKQKQQQLSALRKKLQDRRRQQKKDLHRKHIEEAKSHGLSADSVPAMTLPTNEEIDQDLLRLQQQQETLQAELDKNGAEAGDITVGLYSADLDNRIKHLNLTNAQKDKLIADLMNRSKEAKKRAEELKAKLRQRKERRKSQKLSEEEERRLSADEKNALLKARESQEEADRLSEEQAILDSARMVEKVRKLIHM